MELKQNNSKNKQTNKQTTTRKKKANKQWAKRLKPELGDKIFSFS